MLQCLTARQREAIYLRYMQELSYEEIAEMLHITERVPKTGIPGYDRAEECKALGQMYLTRGPEMI